MPIQFICPNGHPLAAPTKQAGKRGRCPKCDAGYVTPKADDMTGPVPPETGTEAAEGPADKSTVEESFQFLCPNGHKINTPARLAGELGQCPRCGERFHIPEAGLAVGEGGQDDPDSAGHESLSQEESEAAAPVISLGAASGAWPVPASAISGQQTMAEATSWMWQEKRSEQQLEVTLRDGTVIHPTAYAAELNSEQVGFFGTTDQAGGITLRAIAWDAIAQVAISCLTDEVGDLFND